MHSNPSQADRRPEPWVDDAWSIARAYGDALDGRAFELLQALFDPEARLSRPGQCVVGAVAVVEGIRSAVRSGWSPHILGYGRVDRTERSIELDCSYAAVVGGGVAPSLVIGRYELSLVRRGRGLLIARLAITVDGSADLGRDRPITLT